MLRKHSLWSIVGGAVPALVAVIAIPILVAFLGYDLFAITSLIISLTIFFFVYNFGVGRAMTFFTPKPEHGCNDSAAELAGSALLVALILGGFATVLIYLLMPYVAEHWVNVPQEFVGRTALTFQITALGVLPGVVANALKGMLESRREFREANLCKITVSRT